MTPIAETGTDLQKAAAMLRAGSLVAIPTETVYGLAANAFDADAVLHIFEVKRRPTFDPLIVHVGSDGMLSEVAASFPEKAKMLAEKFWPGPLTLVLPRKNRIPDLVTSGLPTVAVRMPQHPLTLELLKILDFPLAAPSANPFGYISPTTAEHVADQLGKDIGYILDGGPCEIGVESTIVTFQNGGVQVLRLGGLDLTEIEAVVGKAELADRTSDNPEAPGMLLSHYAPRKPLLLGDKERLIEDNEHKRIGVLAFSNLGGYFGRELSPTGDLREAARNLFAHLRWLDRQNIDVIIAEPVPNRGIGMAINDRLKRAAHK